MTCEMSQSEEMYLLRSPRKCMFQSSLKKCSAHQCPTPKEPPGCYQAIQSVLQKSQLLLSAYTTFQNDLRKISLLTMFCQQYHFLRLQFCIINFQALLHQKNSQGFVIVFIDSNLPFLIITIIAILITS